MIELVFIIFSLFLYIITLNFEKSAFMLSYHTRRLFTNNFSTISRGGVWKFPHYYYYSARWNVTSQGKHVVFRSRPNHPRQYVLICQNYNAASIIYEGKDTSRWKTHRLGLYIRRNGLSTLA